MYLMHKPTRDLVEIFNFDVLIDPSKKQITGRFHAGEEIQDPATFAKAELQFPSGEALPRCWADASYKLKQRASLS